jgi:hypothetical protein
MKIPFVLPSRIALAGLTWTLLSAGILLTGTQSAQAQTGSSSDLQAPVGASDRDSQNSGDFGSLNNLFNLMNRVQQGSIADPYTFGRTQQQNLNTAAEAFRQRQLELLQQQGQPGMAPSPAPQVSTPGQIAAPNQSVTPRQTGKP